jgi:DNA helicase HerA-like ATPase
VIDEVYDAMKTRQTFTSGTEGPTSDVFRKGRSRGISIVCGTQIPQTLPTDVLDLADTIAVGRLKRRSLAYAERTWELEPEMVAAIRVLERGQFVLLDDASEWDRTVYGPT